MLCRNSPIPPLFGLTVRLSSISLLFYFFTSISPISLASSLERSPTSSQELSPTLLTISQKFLCDRQASSQSSQDTDLISPPPSTVESNDPWAPLKITVSPEPNIGPIPHWALPPHIDKESSSVEIPIPPLAEQTDIENFAITINFMDMGDGGPLIEKQSKNEAFPTLLCSGLGINGPALGINSRTITIPNDLAMDGGKIIVRHVGRFEQLNSITLRPGRTVMVSALNENNAPAIIDHSTIIEQDLAEGALPILKTGDATHGRVTTASLSPSIEELDGSIEFIFDISNKPAATLFKTDILGLDLEAHIDVELNGKSVGPLNISPFELDAPELLDETKKNNSSPQLQIAGWRSSYIYISQDYWREKDNHLLLIVKPSDNAQTSKIHLKNSSLEILHRASLEL
jgi:hypothetical protein